MVVGDKTVSKTNTFQNIPTSKLDEVIDINSIQLVMGLLMLFPV